MSYLDYFKPTIGVRTIDRRVTSSSNKEEIPLTTYSGFIPWLISQYKNKNKDNAVKTTNVIPTEDNTTPYSNSGRKYVVDLHPNYE